MKNSSSISSTVKAAALLAAIELWRQTPDLRYWIVGLAGVAVLAGAVLSF